MCSRAAPTCSAPTSAPSATYTHRSTAAGRINSASPTVSAQWPATRAASPKRGRLARISRRRARAPAGSSPPAAASSARRMTSEAWSSRSCRELSILARAAGAPSPSETISSVGRTLISACGAP